MTNHSCSYDPKDQKLAISAGRIEQLSPTSFRVAVYPDGTKRIQGAYQWRQGLRGGFVWRDLDEVKVDEYGQEITS